MFHTEGSCGQVGQRRRELLSAVCPRRQSSGPLDERISHRRLGSVESNVYRVRC